MVRSRQSGERAPKLELFAPCEGALTRVARSAQPGGLEEQRRAEKPVRAAEGGQVEAGEAALSRHRRERSGLEVGWSDVR